MSEESASAAPTGTAAVAAFYQSVRQDSGLQGQLLAAVSAATPETVADVAQRHGFYFSPDDLRQIMDDRAQRSVQGEVFWNSIVANLSGSDELRDPFIQISGPSWVQTQPYRQMSDVAPPRPTKSLSGLLREIDVDGS